MRAGETRHAGQWARAMVSRSSSGREVGTLELPAPASVSSLTGLQYLPRRVVGVKRAAKAVGAVTWEQEVRSWLGMAVQLTRETEEVLRTSCLELPNVPATVSSSHRFKSARVLFLFPSSTGKFGACFIPGLCKQSDLTLYASRPGLRLWRAGVQGTVQATFLLKDVFAGGVKPFELYPRLDSFDAGSGSFPERQLGLVSCFFREGWVLSWNEYSVYLLDTVNQVGGAAPVRESPGFPGCLWCRTFPRARQGNPVKVYLCRFEKTLGPALAKKLWGVLP